LWAETVPFSFFLKKIFSSPRFMKFYRL